MRDLIIVHSIIHLQCLLGSGPLAAAEAKAGLLDEVRGLVGHLQRPRVGRRHCGGQLHHLEWKVCLSVYEQSLAGIAWLMTTTVCLFGLQSVCLSLPISRMLLQDLANFATVQLYHTHTAARAQCAHRREEQTPTLGYDPSFSLFTLSMFVCVVITAVAAAAAATTTLPLSKMAI